MGSRWQYRYTVLGLCTAAFFATMVARLAISPVVPAITAEFAVSNTVVGIALTGMWMAYSLAQFPSGVFADRFGERRVVLFAVGGTVVGSFLLAAAPIFALFLLFSVLLGALAGFHYTVATTLLSRTYDDIGTAIGVHNGGAPAAGLLAPIAAAWVWSNFGWRPAVALGGVVALPVAVLFAWRIRPTEPRRLDRSLREPFRIDPVAELLSRPTIAFTVALAVFATFIWQGMASFLPAFLIEARGRSSTFAGAVFSAYFVVQGLSQVGIGAASDRYGRDVVLAACMIAAAAGIGLFLAAETIAAIGVAVVLAGVGMSYHAALMARFFDELSEAEQGTGFGLVRTVYGILGALGSVGVGLLADLFGWEAAFGALVALAATVVGALGVNRALGRPC